MSVVSQGHTPERAQRIALASAARAIHASGLAEPDDIEALAASVRSGQTTVVALADKIQADKKCDREQAFVLAERMVRGR